MARAQQHSAQLAECGRRSALGADPVFARTVNAQFILPWRSLPRQTIARPVLPRRCQRNPCRYQGYWRDATRTPSVVGEWSRHSALDRHSLPAKCNEHRLALLGSEDSVRQETDVQVTFALPFLGHGCGQRRPEPRSTVTTVALGLSLPDSPHRTVAVQGLKLSAHDSRTTGQYRR